MEGWITSVMEQFGYLGIFLLIMLENVFPPIPSEVILTFGGYMTTHTNLTVVGVVVASTIGSVAGGIVLYSIGLQIDVDKLEKIIERWGHILKLSKKDVHKANKWFSKYGVWTVFFCRFIPLIRSLISLPAGMAHMNVWTFLVLTTLGTLVWNVVLVNVGAAVAGSWENIVGYMDIYSNVVYLILALLFLIFVALFVRKRIM
ncbi:alkaline phosphatase [Sporosarcina globispora]|uniref:Alkaline phosphatase n=1 Tax=Sporosarcina globispora TaxID=1459 RepID=A0A0M0GDZ1_SPOGL|nr:DedA family protein [Sporosarcina globispora]KON88140.1 alkaline phosphatase [Sporosarcina globispora]